MQRALEEGLANIKEWSDDEKESYIKEMGNAPLWAEGDEADYVRDALETEVYDDSEEPIVKMNEAKARGNRAYQKGE